MLKSVIEIFAWVVSGYLMTGVLFLIAFQWVGLSALDPGARGSGWLFRILISPGIIAFWPWLASRWKDNFRSPGSPPPEVVSPETLRRLHLGAWCLISVGVPIVLAASLYWRPPPLPRQAVPLSHSP